MEEFSGISEEEREDGEIVDDFEDISDYSIPTSGKSDYNQDLLRAISLSSISDSEGERENGRKPFLPPTKKRHRCRDHHRKKKRKKHEDFYYDYTYRSHKNRSPYTPYSPSSPSSTDSDMEKLDKRTLRQLKEAVRINDLHDLHHNSLRTRLKVMIEPGSQEDEDVETLRTLALLTSRNKNEEDATTNENKQTDDVEQNETLYDKELAELRSEALKSAVMKKHMERKKRKELDIKAEEERNISSSIENNDKENEKNNIMNNVDSTINDNKHKEEINSNTENNTIEDDVDVMRAMLLASMSKKITSKELPSVFNKNPVTSTPNHLIIKPKFHNLRKPMVKTKNLVPQKSIPQTHLKLPFVKPLIINLKSDSESEPEKAEQQQPEVNPIDKTVANFLKKQREQYEAKLNNSEEKPNNKESELDKSVLKLLSKAQQREYQILKQKLLLARKRKIRRLSQRLMNGKSEISPRNEEEAAPSSLKKTLQQLQFQKDGRLQMKGKYKELAPLIQKVNVASNKRKQCEETIKNLLDQLKTARTELGASHENFTNLVQKLMQAKENIDKRITKLGLAKKNIGIVSSTTNPLALELVKKGTEGDENKPETTVDLKENETPQNYNTQVEINIVNKIQEEEVPRVVAKAAETKYTNYVSPLDNRETVTPNPLQMLCPYELFGVCKDQECNFNHCP